MSEQGRKYDGGKLRYDLIPVLALEEMVKGLTYGTIKYDDNNWVKVPEGRKRYMAATLRHIQEYRKGNLWDEEQDIHHLAAAMNNLSFIVEKDLRGWEDNSDERASHEEDISQEELKAYVSDTLVMGNPTGGASHSFELDTSHFPWYPPVKEGENPWIEYTGDHQPVADAIRVQWLTASERINKSWVDMEDYADTLSWGKGTTLVAYRVVD